MHTTDAAGGPGRRPLPEPARSVAAAVTGAVTAARSGDPEAYAASVTRLGALDPEHTGLVLGAMARLLLEDAHPGGMTADDVRALVARCARAAAPVYPRADPDVLVMLVAAALGVHQHQDGGIPLDAQVTAAHAPLLVAALLADSGHPLAGCLDAALADLELAGRADTP
ncbi:hypothetical protein Sru01_35650 [Sphaerisporangium rufum]|uniref:Uncharacterized protein n=1 Tax=Sphaerisporangium rufum TaxID=1381558 RepID=A0A919V260_9ACTN|nr:hypothetical protein [Sphaerisporangium rufum]GII78583.1 hypothetical protein Sru01_35650 [Sphaerisporangium rufum]